MDLFVARQPIFDRDRAVYGYELLFRSGPENFFSHDDLDEASNAVIGDSVASFGLDPLIGQSRGFYNCTRRVLLEETYTVLPRERTVVELLENIEPDDEVIAACKTLKQSGYLLALDDFVFRTEFEPLLPFADIVKVDLLGTSPEMRREHSQRLLDRGVQLLAEKVETHEQFTEAAGLGYRYFQGYFFCRPEMVSRKELSASKTQCLQFLKELNRLEIDYDRLEQVIKREVSLSVRLLRFLNSAAFGWRDRVTSIKQALILLGETPLRKWGALVALRLLGDDKPAELISTCLVRARLCELLAPRVQLESREMDLFFMGMLSVVDALVGRPMNEVLEELSVAPEIREALLGADTRFGHVLALILAYERADWATIEARAEVLGLPEDVLPELFSCSLTWAREIFETSR